MKKLLTFLLLITAFTSSAQVYQNDPSYGRSIDRYEVRKDLGIPTFCGVPSINSTVTNKAKIAYDSCGHKFYVYDPSTETWGQVTGGGVIIDPGVDSITYHNNQLCQWVSGVSTCYFLNKFYDSTALNHDSTKILHFNSGNLVDSVLIPTGTIHIIQDGAGETNIVRVEDSTRLHFPTLKNTDDITVSKASDSAVLFNFTVPHYTKDQVDSIAATLTASGITRAELIDTADNKVNKTDVSGGAINQVLKKNSSTDYDWSWQDESGGVAQSVISDTLKNYANSGSITTDNVIYSTPIALSVANHLMTGALALKSQSAYSLFGRGSGSGSPSFLSAIDSNWVSGLHSEDYYNTKYAGLTTYGQWLKNGSNIYRNIGKVGIGDTAKSLLSVTANDMGTSSPDSMGISLVNETAPASSVFLQDSPPLVFKYKVYNGSSYRTFFFRIVARGVPGNPTQGKLDFQYSKDSGATYTTQFSLNSNNSNSITGSLLGISTLGVAILSAGNVNSTGPILSTRGTGFSSGTNTDNVYSWTGQVNNTGGTNTIRGVYLNPTLISTTGTTVIGFQNEVGNNFFNTTSGATSVGQTTTIPSSAIFQAASTTQGTLITRMTKTQRNAIASPAPGLMVIVTGETGGEYLSWYNSSTSGWVKVTSTAD